MANRNPAREGSERGEQALEGVSAESKRLIEVMLNHLVEAEGNFVAVYDAALKQVKDADAKAKLREFRGDHERHVKELRGALDQIDADVIVTEPKPTPLGRGLAQRFNRVDDEMVLAHEMLVNEDYSRRTYQWASMLGLPEPLSRVVQRAMDDEDRHYRWAARQSRVEPEPL